VGRVPPYFIQELATSEADLRLSLGDGTAVSFFVVDADGRIDGGHRYKQTLP
jgi:hypothetical protein